MAKDYKKYFDAHPGVAAPVAGSGDASTVSGKKGGKKETPATGGDDPGKTE